METPKLYIKNEKGRYEEYKEPPSPYSNCLYRRIKIGKKVTYEPCSMLMTDDLGEGVWVVVKHIGSKSITSGLYMRDMYMCQKASDIQDVSLAKLGGMERLADYLSNHWNELPTNTSTYDLCRAIVGMLFKYEKEKDGK